MTCYHAQKALTDHLKVIRTEKELYEEFLKAEEGRGLGGKEIISAEVAVNTGELQGTSVRNLVPKRDLKG